MSRSAEFPDPLHASTKETARGVSIVVQASEEFVVGPNFIANGDSDLQVRNIGRVYRRTRVLVVR